MQLFFIISILAVTLITGCTTKNNQPPDMELPRIISAADTCVAELSKKVVGGEGKYVFTFAFYVNSESTQLFHGNYTKSEKTGIPYFIASSLDFSDPGSAWRNCMLKQDALVTKIKFPKT